jgi:hypothetical protein
MLHEAFRPFLRGEISAKALKNRARTDAKIKVQDVVRLDELLHFAVVYLVICQIGVPRSTHSFAAY